MKVVEFQPKPPFLISPHLERFCPKGLPVPCLYENKKCRRLIEVCGEYVPYEVEIISEGEKPKLKVLVFSDSNVKQTVRLVKEIYRVNFDYKKFLDKCKNTPIYPIAKKYYGLRPTRMISIYEALVDSIIEQNISLYLAFRIKSGFVKKFGMKRTIKGREFYSFPSAEKVAKLKAKTLKKKIRTTLTKAGAIIEVAKLKEGFPTLKQIEKHPEEFMEFITKVKGIGKWTAEISVAKVSKNFYVGPFGDLAVRRGFKRVLGIEKETEMKKMLSKLKEYIGLVLYLLALEGHKRRK